MSGQSMFDINDEGWIAQQAAREPWELVREIIQNALDTGEDFTVRVDKRNRAVEVVDTGEGFNDLSDAYTIFGGDKGDDPTKRGRFGRGLKELVAASQFVEVESTAGTVRFDVEARERTEHPDETRENGTRVRAENEDWTSDEIDEIRTYIMKFWVPPGQTMTVDIVGGRTLEKERWTPLTQFQARLKTEVVKDGVLDTTYRSTTVYVMEADKSGTGGRIYEMGIPVTLDEDFPFYVDIQQKIPMAEGRHQPKSGFTRRLKGELINHVYEHLTQTQKRKDWVSAALNHHKANDDVKQQYAYDILADNRKRDTVTRSNQHADRVAEQNGYHLLDTSRMSKSRRKIAHHVFQTSEAVAEEVHERREEQATPTPAQQELLEYLNGLAEEAGIDQRFELWNIEENPDGTLNRATFNDDVIRLNNQTDQWKGINEQSVGQAMLFVLNESQKPEVVLGRLLS